VAVENYIKVKEWELYYPITDEQMTQLDSPVSLTQSISIQPEFLDPLLIVNKRYHGYHASCGCHNDTAEDFSPLALIANFEHVAMQ
jgi:hypothetical protein